MSKNPDMGKHRKSENSVLGPSLLSARLGAIYSEDALLPGSILFLSMPSTGDGHLAGFCVVTGRLHYPILKVLTWNNAMGVMAKRRAKMLWEPWHFPHLFAMAPMACFHTETFEMG